MSHRSPRHHLFAMCAEQPSTLLMHSHNPSSLLFKCQLFSIYMESSNQTIESQILQNVHDYIYIYSCTASKKGQADEKRKLLSFVLDILIGALWENIDWSLPASVEHVCDVLGVKNSKVYNVRKSGPVKCVCPKRQRRSDAVDKQPWWPQASAVTCVVFDWLIPSRILFPEFMNATSS